MDRKYALSVRFVANTPDKRERGLMFASPLAENETAFFVFPTPSRYAFWNKNVPFALSLAFLDENGRVVDMLDMDAYSTRCAEPESDNVKFVIEAAKGTFERLGVKKGDHFQYKDFCLEVSPSGRRNG